MKIGISADHRAVDLKNEIINYLIRKGYEVENFGTDSYERTDYPIYSIKVGEAIRDKKIDYGIALCGSAIGASIACNKVKGVRCGKVNTVDEVIHGKENDYINVISFPGNYSINEAILLIDAFINTKHKDDVAYQKRVDMIEEYEQNA